MYFLFVVLLLIIVPYSVSILGGVDISIDEVPYQVNYGDVCGGALIHRKWVLTTAHCGTDVTYVRIGSSHHTRGSKIRVLLHVIHPKFGHKHRFDYDVQLLRLYRGLHFGRSVNSIEISDGGIGEWVSVTGWGYPVEKGDYQDILQMVKLKVVPLHKCQEVQQPWYNHSLTSRMFCAGGGSKDACQGDSGGAAVFQGRLVGISSFGWGCGRHIPGVYANVTHPEIRQWINHRTGV